MSPPVDRGPGGPIEVVHGVDGDRILVRGDVHLSLAEPLRAAAFDLLAGGGVGRLAVEP